MSSRAASDSFFYDLVPDVFSHPRESLAKKKIKKTSPHECKRASRPEQNLSKQNSSLKLPETTQNTREAQSLHSRL
jgi:hypothetical protein